ncbi:MAG TPA: hypothetical protein VM553_07260 [Dongiaceae bacterium]|nr:hypothetical protein [Dongiaceae bacterium]
MKPPRVLINIEGQPNNPVTRLLNQVGAEFFGASISNAVKYPDFVATFQLGFVRQCELEMLEHFVFGMAWRKAVAQNPYQGKLDVKSRSVAARHTVARRGKRSLCKGMDVMMLD